MVGEGLAPTGVAGACSLWTVRKHGAGRKPGYSVNLKAHTPLSSANLHLLKVLQTPKAAPGPGDQCSNTGACRRNFTFKLLLIPVQTVGRLKEHYVLHMSDFTANE